ncbi:ABC transporter permease [Arthrobacter ginkgonis]|uniref:ABC transporter permease n=1 Tax=Arthrobacter ginkgonis TaxID=1630594 RepID=A0ABP7CDG0_9MICC
MGTESTLSTKSEPSTEPTVTSPARTAPAAPSASDLGRLEAGLDQLQRVDPVARRGTFGSRLLWPLGALAAVVSLWQILAWSGIKRDDLLPGPGQVAAIVAEQAASGALAEAVGTSLARGGLGFLIAVAIGTPIALVLAQLPALRRAVGPLISGLQVLPSVAWVPAAIIWFGLTDATVYFVVLMGATPSIINGLLAGIDTIPPHYAQVGHVLGASRWQHTLLITLPAALPGYLGGLKQGWAFSWRSLMAAEIIAVGGSIGFGLGSLLQQGRDLSDMGLVITAILAILVVGILVELLLFAPVERALLARRGLAKGHSA